MYSKYDFVLGASNHMRPWTKTGKVTMEARGMPSYLVYYKMFTLLIFVIFDTLSNNIMHNGIIGVIFYLPVTGTKPRPENPSYQLMYGCKYGFRSHLLIDAF